MQDRMPLARSRRAWDASAFGFALLICALTLTPAERPGSPTALGFDSPSIADDLRNVVLFAPLALSLVLAGHRRLRSLALCAALSATIESLQRIIPGRTGGISDVLTNTLGSGVAILLFSTWRVWVLPRRPWSLLLRAGALAIPWSAIAVSGYLCSVWLPEGQSYGGWNQEFEGMGVYPGEVLDARIGEEPIARGGPAANAPALRRALLANAPVVVRWKRAPAPARLAPLVVLIGPESEEILLVAVRRSDLVLREWRQSARLLLEQPSLTWPDALEKSRPGEVAELVVHPSRSGAGLSLDGADLGHAGLGPGRAWAVLAPDTWVTPRLRPALDAVWLAILLFPAGLWLPAGRSGLVFAAAALAGVACVPGPVGLDPATAVEWAGALGGLLAGWRAAALARRSVSGRPRSSAG
jgi:VanZ family protein